MFFFPKGEKSNVQETPAVLNSQNIIIGREIEMTRALLDSIVPCDKTEANSTDKKLKNRTEMIMKLPSNGTFSLCYRFGSCAS